MTALQNALANAEAQIGREVGVSNWITVDQAMIDSFADATHDQQWIHTDPERAAAESPFGTTIAHGFLTLSLASRFAYDCFETLEGQVMSVNYGLNKLRFLNPVKAGSRVRGRFVLKEIKARNERELLRTNILTIEIEGEETPALVAEWLGLAVFQD
ncbi:MaoC family dehydratase [Phaeobacter sp. PT47_59]|uniref:MaoC family dehydratase n=1 Tax=Phaeobacter sp. PT47_59 TaxID=3029979 RepID=UPI0023805738|nr:MaoC family dehydratase [Phaeobacter sp. PT47_59]MDE4174236.1 MaoC family dehydratase [Phaeobacter sp. PT47_59]